MAISWPTETNQNIEVSTRKLWVKTAVDQVLFKMPLYARILMGGGVRQSVTGGNMITRPVITDDLEDLGQDYDENDQLQGGSKTLLDAPSFLWKNFQIPVTYGPKEEFENAGGSETQTLDLTTLLVERATYSARKHMYKLMYDTAATPTSTDSGKKFQSVVQALDHDTTYGHLTRSQSAGTRNWWQSSDINDIYAGNASTQGTAYACSIETVRKMIDAVAERVPVGQESEFLGVCGPANYLTLKSWVQTEHGKTNFTGPMAKYGFDSIMIDNVEFVKDPYLKTGNITDSHKWMFLFHVPSWNLYLHPRRSFLFTGFRWQGDIEGGYDRWLARIMCRGNLVCWQPQANIWLSNCS